MAVQAVLDIKDVPTGTALILFLQTMGGSVFVSVAQNIWENKLHVLRAGATSLQDAVSPELVGAVTVVYNKALVSAFYVATATACLSAVGALIIEWKSIKVPLEELAPASTTEAA
ncbi:hypothetical protein B0H11DRAFT_2234898 [Mycena galericulata]|nr:hypothetical protein B0H11DRAFT_2234898 [Mycena galericulata]